MRVGARFSIGRFAFLGRVFSREGFRRAQGDAAYFDPFNTRAYLFFVEFFRLLGQLTCPPTYAAPIASPLFFQLASSSVAQYGRRSLPDQSPRRYLLPSQCR